MGEPENSKEISFKEQRIKHITNLYYSKPEVQEAIFNFAKNREVCPRYFEGFGKRPDTLEYKGDLFELARKGATSFHCSEELWKNPLEIETGMNQDVANSLRIGWDFLVDIDSKYIDYSKIMAKEIIKVLEFHRVKNIGIKFSVSSDTPVLIKEGKEISLIDISKVIELLKEGKKLEVLSLDKNRKIQFSKIYSFLEHRDTLYEINHSQSTLPLKATEHHSVFVWDKGEIIQKKVSELKKNDFLISYNAKENPFAIKNPIAINKFEFNKNQHKKSLIKKEVQITTDLMRLVGYFLAEGHVTNRINQVGFSFNIKELESIEDVKQILNSITGGKLSIRHPNRNSIQILIHSKEWANFFDFFCGKKKEKHVPSFAFSSSKELFLELLKGYIRGDGYKLGKQGIVVKSVSKKLITEMIWLCKLNGISCNLAYEQNKEHRFSQGTLFKGSLVYLLRISKSELENLEFYRERNKFSPYVGDKVFPTDGLKAIYQQIKPKMFNSHREEQMTFKKSRANLTRIKKVLEWFEKFKSKEYNENSRKILANYEKLFNADIAVIKIFEINKKKEERVYDLSVENTESFFGNYYPVLLHNSGSKGFHMIIPWKAFPKEVNGIATSQMFPEWPRIILSYLAEKSKPGLIKEITKLSTKNEYVRDEGASKEVIPDLVLVSPRHLFRMPYSLHEKTALASVVIEKEDLDAFQLKDADPLKVKVKNFTPNSKEGEASELLREALDWHNQKIISKPEKTVFVHAEIKIKDFSEKTLPPCIKNILNGIKSDGRKRALFILINFFRSCGMDKDELEKKIYDWDKKNKPPLGDVYIKPQLSWNYKRKPLLPPNCKEFYQGIGVCTPEEFCGKIKNPLNYIIRKEFSAPKKVSSSKAKFKNNL